MIPSEPTETIGRTVWGLLEGATAAVAADEEDGC